MMLGMTVKEKVAVSLPPELLAAAKSAVANGRVESVSASMADALRAKACMTTCSVSSMR